jgi:hypothetical protein
MKKRRDQASFRQRKEGIHHERKVRVDKAQQAQWSSLGNKFGEAHQQELMNVANQSVRACGPPRSEIPKLLLD